MALQFGTDGVRGAADTELTAEFVLALGHAAAGVLGGRRWYVGRDTRESGPGLSAALAAGLVTEGIDVVDLGVAPTPAVAFVSETQHAPAAVISASHNPFSDNGVKLFAAGGRKLTDDVEAAIEAGLSSAPGPAPGPALGPAPGGTGGTVTADPTAIDAYVEHLVGCVDSRRIDGMKVVIDCANGAASALAPLVLSRLGADLTVLHAEPDGRNINAACGSTHPGDLVAAVRDANADLGLAFDGDADRVLAVDGAGDLVDGDHLMAICALDMHARGVLEGDAVVVTAMTNLGFRQAMAAAGITVIETERLGDRYVLEELERRGLALGGEQSGHIVFRDQATTGDGILTGLRLLDVLKRSGRTLEDLARSSMRRLPQVLRNVAVLDRSGLDSAHGVWAEVAAVEAELGEHGRVLLRPSGTEPVVRVMVEAPTHAEARSAAERVCRAVEDALDRPRA